jgi:hypothetical protein
MFCVDLGYVGSETSLRSRSTMSLLGLVLKADFFTDSLGGLTIDRHRWGLRCGLSMLRRSSIHLPNALTSLRLPRALSPMTCTIDLAPRVWRALVYSSSLKPIRANDLNACGVTKERCHQQGLSIVFVGNWMDG